MSSRESSRNDNSYVFMIKSELLFFWIFLIIIFSWICIDLFGRWLNNFTFVTLGLNEKSPWHTFIIAITVTAILFTCIIFLKHTGYDLEPSIYSNNDNNDNALNSNSVLPLPQEVFFFRNIEF